MVCNQKSLKAHRLGVGISKIDRPENNKLVLGSTLVTDHPRSFAAFLITDTEGTETAIEIQIPCIEHLAVWLDASNDRIGEFLAIGCLSHDSPTVMNVAVSMVLSVIKYRTGLRLDVAIIESSRFLMVRLGGLLSQATGPSVSAIGEMPQRFVIPV